MDVNNYLSKITRYGKYLLLLLFVFAAIYGLIFFINNGRVVVKTDTGLEVKDVSYCTEQCDNLTSTNGSSSFIAPKGKYFVKVSLSNESEYTSTILVEGLLKTVTIDAAPQTYTISTFATNTRQYILPTKDGYITYDQNSPIVSSGNFSIFDSHSVIATLYLDGNIFIVSTFSLEHEAPESTSVTLYTAQTNSISKLGEIEGYVSSDMIYRSRDALYLINPDNTKITKVSASGLENFSLPSSIRYAQANGAPILSFGSNTIAVLQGNDYSEHHDDLEETVEAPENNSIISLYSLVDFSKTGEVNIGKRNDVLGLSLSPDGNYIATLGEGEFQVYNIQTKESVFVTSAVVFPEVRPIWKDDDSILYQSGTGGVNLANLTKGYSRSIINNNFLNIYYLSDVINNKLYLTAYQKSAYSSSLPNGYLVDFNTSSGSSSMDENSIIHALPHRGATYSIGYHFSGTDLELDIDTYSNRNIAIGGIYDIDFDPGDYKINFKNYTNPFKE